MSKSKKPEKIIETSTKEKDGVTYTKTETTIVGRDSVILSFVREYNPPIKYPMTWEDI